MTDRELDALVAEKVMGWRFVGALDETKRPYFQTTWDASAHGGPTDAIRKIDCRRFKPSTSLVDAWEVMEKLGDGCVNEFRLKRSGSGRTGWHAHFYRPDLSSADGWAVIAPRAICLAALRAVGVEVPE